MKSKANFQIIGRVGTVANTLQVGTNKVLKFSVACNYKHKTDTGTTIDNTNWYNIEAWNSLAGIGEKIISVGTQVCVEGIIVPNKYKKNEVDVHTLNLKATDIFVFGCKKETQEK